jgi:hypothetical protein
MCEKKLLSDVIDPSKIFVYTGTIWGNANGTILSGNEVLDFLAVLPEMDGDMITAHEGDKDKTGYFFRSNAIWHRFGTDGEEEVLVEK